eukprot:gene21530-27565_t
MFQCTLKIPDIFGDDSFEGDVCNLKKDAEYSAIKALLIKPDCVITSVAVPTQVSSDPPAMSIQREEQHSSTNAPQDVDDDYPVKDVQGKKQKLVHSSSTSDILSAASGLLSSLDSETLPVSLVVGATDIVESGGEIGEELVEFEEDRMQVVEDSKVEDIMDSGSVDSSPISSITTSSSTGNAVNDCKSALNIIMLMKKGVPSGEIQKMMVFDTVQSNGLWRCSFSLRGFRNGQVFTGGEFAKKGLAEQTAVQTLLLNEDVRRELDAWRPFSDASLPSPSSSSKVQSSEAGVGSPSHPMEGDDANSVVSEITNASGEASVENIKGRLQGLLQGKGRAPSSSLIVYSTTRDAATSICVCTVSVPSILGDRQFTGQSCSNQKGAEKLAAAALLADEEAFEKLNTWQPVVEAFTLAVESVLCTNCKCVLSSAGDFMFFHTAENAVSFTLKPEVILSRAGGVAGSPFTVTSKESVSSKFNEQHVSCAQCSAKVGCQLSTGPDNASVVAFDLERICTEHGAFKYRSWSEASKCFEEQFERRDYADYFVKWVARRPLVVNTRKIYAIVSHARSSGLSGNVSNDVFEWLDLFVAGSPLVPHRFQIEAYRLSLMGNLIVVIPTGAGKTLIAAMTMRRMKMLNPHRLVVMVVDRIPLVEQQAGAIRNATDLVLFPLSSATKSRRVLQKIVDGHYDGIVVTAGLLADLFKMAYLRLEDFSLMVFDECHHVTGDHHYRKILKDVRDINDANRPMLLGLSASPCQAARVDRAIRKLEDMQFDFGGGKIYKPAYKIETTTDVDTTTLKVVPTAPQQRMQRHLAERLWTHFQSLSASKYEFSEETTSLTPECCHDSSKWGRFQQAASEVGVRATEPAQKVLATVRDLQVNYLLGPVFLTEEMTNGSHRDIVRWIKREYEQSVSGVAEMAEEAAVEAVVAVGEDFDESDDVDEGVDEIVLDEEVNGGEEEEDLILSPEECEHFLKYASSQLSALCTRLNTCNDQNKLLVFVETRYNAKLVDKVLKVLAPQFRSSKIIGQGDFDGMAWRGDAGQRAVLEQFVRGEVRLIVCTSVLEEGLDVKDCDYVFRFGGRPSLIQLIQSKGRARAKNNGGRNGQLVLIYTEEEEAHFVKIQAQEDIVNMALLNKSAVFPGNDLEQSQDTQAKNVMRENMVSGTVGMRRYCLPLVVCSSSPRLQHGIQSALEDTTLVSQVTNIEVFYGAANEKLSVAAGKLFGDDDSAALVSFSSDKTIFGDFLRMLVGFWDFQVCGKASFIPLSCLLETSGSSSKGAATTATQSSFTLSGVQSVSVGHFTSHNAYIQQGPLGGEQVRYHKVVIDSGREVQLVGMAPGSESGTTAVVSMKVTSLGNSAYLSHSRSRDSVTLYLTLRSTPTVLAVSGKAKKRVFCPNLLRDDTNACDGLQRDLELLSRCPVVAVTFPASQWKVISALLADAQILGVPTLLTKIFESTAAATLQSNGLAVSGVSSDDIPLGLVHRACVWMFATLQSSVHCLTFNPLVFAHIHSVLECAIVDQNIDGLLHCFKAMQQLLLVSADSSQQLSAVLFFDLSLQMIASSVAQQAMDVTQELEGAVPEGYQLVRRVVATPSRLHILPSTHIKTNRLVRKFGHQHMFVYVYFCDEQGQPIYDEGVFRGRFRDMIDRGFDLCGHHFQFAACSNSQLRERTCVFVLGDKQTVQGIRDELVHPSLLAKQGVVKYLSRLGLFCTADYDRAELNEGRFDTTDDIQTTGGKLLTDGCGLISEMFMKIVCAEYFAATNRCPSLIQVRVLGCKGTLLVDPNMSPEFDVMFRPSMQKCDSGHMTLCVVKEAGYNPVRLNREIINLLCALGGEGIKGGDYDPLYRSMELLGDALDANSQMLLNQAVALEILSRYIDAETIGYLVRARVNVLTEPHWWSLLQLIYLQETKALRKKTHIPVSEGCLAMGAADPSGLLRDGQIFLRVIRPKNDQLAGEAVEYEEVPVKGPVIIYRNPCLDPGDVRFVEAVDVDDYPQLKHVTNVVILPASASNTRSLSAECSGGDLDGDQFSVIWDKLLVPPPSREKTPVDYAQIGQCVDTETGESIAANTSQMSEAEFVSTTMCNASLGRIANLHLALCDQLQSGASDKLARSLAVEQSKAVDYPKTGIPPRVPEAAKDMVRRQGYPDFMENKIKQSYLSKKLLGKLYHKVCAVGCDIEFLSREADFTRDSSFLVPVEEALQAAVNVIYESYVSDVKQLLVRFGLRSEAELVLGSPYEWADDFALDHVSSATALVASWRALRSGYRSIFINFDCSVYSLDRSSLAAAWYTAAYVDRHAFHSFAWIVTDFLVANRCRSLHFGEAILILDTKSLDLSVTESIGGSAKSHWLASLSDLKKSLRSKLRVFERLRESILQGAAVCEGSELTVSLYGSVSLLLCDFDSDIDVFVALSSYPCESPAQEVQLLDTAIFHAIDGDRTARQYNTEVPIIKMQLEELSVVTSVDICAREDGLQKAQYIRALYAQNPAVLPLFCCVKQWAQHSGLVKGFAADKRGATLNSGQLQALILHYLTVSEVLPSSVAAGSDVIDADILSAAADCDPQSVGRLVLGFFLFFAKMEESELVFVWPIKCRAVHSFDAPSMETISSLSQRACHYLAVTRDWVFLLAQCAAHHESITTLTVTLSRTLSAQIADNAEYHAKRLQFASGAEVTITPETDLRDASLVARGHGTCHQIQQLRAELVKLMRDGRALAYGAISTKSGVYFMENSTLLSAREMDSPDAMVALNLLFEGQLTVHRRHALQEVSTLALTSSKSSTWGEDFCASLVDKVVDQLSRMDEKLTADLEFSVHFGAFYMLNASNAFNKQRCAVPLSDVQLAMTNGRRNRQFDSVDRAEYDDTSRVKVKNTSLGSAKSEDRSPAKAKGSGSAGGGGAQSGTKKKASRSDGKVATSFMSSIPMPVVGSTESNALLSAPDDEADMERRFRALADLLCYSYHTVVDETSVRQGEEAVLKTVPHTQLRVPCCRCFIVEVNPSPSYSVTVCLDDTLRVFKAKQRFLSWVHGTLLSAGKEATPASASKEGATEPKESADTLPSHIQRFRDHDVRFKIGTSEAVSTDSALFADACPDGQSPISLLEGGRVAPSEAMRVKEKVAFVRQIKKKVYFLSPTYADHVDNHNADALGGGTMKPPVVMLIFAIGTHFSGEDGLSDVQPFVDVSVEVDTAPLARWICGGEGGMEEDEVRAWLDRATREVLRVSEAIRASW